MFSYSAIQYLTIKINDMFEAKQNLKSIIEIKEYSIHEKYIYVYMCGVSFSVA